MSGRKNRISLIAGSGGQVLRSSGRDDCSLPGGAARRLASGNRDPDRLLRVLIATLLKYFGCIESSL
jgi:hypothetical protein